MFSFRMSRYIQYENYWDNNFRSGKGVFFKRHPLSLENYSLVERYEGEFKQGQYHGKGRYIFEDGETYEGNWKMGKKHGRGVISYPRNGVRFEGLFENDLKHGKGRYVFADGQIQYGIYREGQRMQCVQK